MNFFEFYTGKEFYAYRWLGAHWNGTETVFRTFAPNAARIDLLLQDRCIPMVQPADRNFFEVTVADALPGQCYEYRIWQRDGSYTDHCDPYGYGMQLRPDHKSVIRDLNEYTFSDEEWMKGRSAMTDRPLNIYEMHVGSWRKKGQEQDAWYTYTELGDLLIPYLLENGYNYVEFMPLCEHPSDESWGYQNTGYYSPTSRYGTAAQLKELIDRLHRNGIGVILDFVPVHFAVDAYGLARYGGDCLYEYPNSDVGRSEWGSCNFMHSRGEVRSFLQSSAQFWLSEFHFDGLRMDAISRIIYWQGDEKRGVNGNGIDFIRTMNGFLKRTNPGCMLIAEDSTNFPRVTSPAEQGGLGFDYKWDMGWMHDTLDFFQTPAAKRSASYHKLTFSMMYYYSEQYLLPFSHDEVVHLKKTILDKLCGTYDEKFPQGRALGMYMMVHPGKKLNFMGNEIGQLREWDEKREQDWDLLRYPLHDSFHAFVRKLNQLYLTHPALSQGDYDREGFRWLDCHQEKKCVYTILRSGGGENLAAVFNFSDQSWEDYEVQLPEGSEAQVLLDTDWDVYSGSTCQEESRVEQTGDRLICTLPPYSAILLKLN